MFKELQIKNRAWLPRPQIAQRAPVQNPGQIISMPNSYAGNDQSGTAKSRAGQS